MTVRPSRGLATYAAVAAVVALLCSPLLALAWLATPQGASTAQLPTVAAWTEPARALAGGLLEFAEPDRVYATYTQALALVVPALPLVAAAERSRRPRPSGRPQRVGWRVALTGYSLFTAGLLVSASAMLGDAASPVVDVAFVAAMLPGLLLALVGSTVLGIALLRGAGPRLTAWLLALSFPLWVVGGVGLGHNSLGLLPLFVAGAAAARQWPQVRGHQVAVAQAARSSCSRSRSADQAPRPTGTA